jgi:manganese/zinc/iron transport system permease protein
VITLTITQKVIIGTSLLGAVSGLVGSFAVLRRRALVGDMLAHAALPGLCTAFLLGALAEPLLLEHFQIDVSLRRNLLVLLAGAFASGLLGVCLMTVVCRWTRTKEDAAIGIVLSTFFGAGVVMLSIIGRLPLDDRAGLSSYLFGQAAAMRNQDIFVIAGVSLAALIVLALFYKEFKVFSFDADFARSQGWPTLALDLTMMATLTVVTIVGLPAVGVVLMAALIIIPGAAARFWTDRLGRMLALSALFGMVTGLLGSIASSRVLERTWGFDPFQFLTGGGPMPTGPIIVLCGAALFLFSVLFAPRRGIVARMWSQWTLRRKTARENLLRTMYELSESRLPTLPEIPVETVQSNRAWSRAAVDHLIRRAAYRNLVTVHGNTVQLTQTGLVRAAQMTRNHRLWELFLIEGAGIAADHVDRDADSIEHVLTPEMIAQLEEQLASTGQLPEMADTVPDSPHQLLGDAQAEEVGHG